MTGWRVICRTWSFKAAVIFFAGVVCALLFGGTKAGDVYPLKIPFEGRDVNCIVIEPAGFGAAGVVIYVPGAGVDYRDAGRMVSAFSEQGLACVVVSYDRYDVDLALRQVAAVNSYMLKRRPGKQVWVGASLGAQHLMELWLNVGESELPAVFVRISGGWVPSMAGRIGIDFKRGQKALGLQVTGLNGRDGRGLEGRRIIQVHGEADKVFPVENLALIHRRLEEMGADAELYVVSNAEHVFPRTEREQVMRRLSELCKSGIRSRHVMGSDWIAWTWPIWVMCLTCGLFFVVDGIASRFCAGTAGKWGGSWMLVVAGVVCLLKIGCLISPAKWVGDGILGAAVIDSRVRDGYIWLRRLPALEDRPVGWMLLNVELADFYPGFVLGDPPETIERKYMLSPIIVDQEDILWRYVLWSRFYSRVKRGRSVDEFAEAVRDALLEQVVDGERYGIVERGDDHLGRKVLEVLESGYYATDQEFGALCVACMRALGVCARMSERGRCEYFSSGNWIELEENELLIESER